MKFNKKYLMFGIPLLLVGLVVAGVVYSSIHTTITVSEALTTTTTTVAFTAFTGETNQQCFTVTNSANVPLKTALSYVESSNINGVTYTTDMPKTVTLASGDNTVCVSATINPDSVAGNVEGDVTLTRVA